MRRRHTRDAVVVVVIIAVVAGLGWWVFGGSNDACCPASASSPGNGVVRSGNIDLLALSVAGGPAPYLAVVGTGPGGSRPAAVPIPSNLVIVVPGQGETPAKGVGALSGSSIQVALSNVTGTWVQEYAVMDIPQFQDVVERAGGITVDLAVPEATSAGVIGPGSVQLSGEQAGALLRMKGGDSDVRWQQTLAGLLTAGPTVRRVDLTSASSVGGVQQVLDATVEAEVLPMPLNTVAGTAAIPAQPQFDELLASTWRTVQPTPVIVQNGSGAPGVGEEVARRIIPAGFRVVISQNATTFDVARTDIIANGLVHVNEARQVRKVMGVGLVQASRVPSGIGDITIVVGKDFTA